MQTQMTKGPPRQPLKDLKWTTEVPLVYHEKPGHEKGNLTRKPTIKPTL
jgi:hypothetical protein